MVINRNKGNKEINYGDVIANYKINDNSIDNNSNNINNNNNSIRSSYKTIMKMITMKERKNVKTKSTLR